MAAVSMDLTAAILLLALAYAMGIILSGISAPITKFILKIRKLDEPRDAIPLPELEPGIILALKDVLKAEAETDLQWSATYFYLCRSIVQERLPNSAQAVSRQIGLRQLRENMLAPILIWLIAGIGWGMWSIVHGVVTWGVVLIVGSTISSFIVIVSITNKMYGNRKRAVREVCTAFLAGYSMGILESNTKENSQSTML